MDIMITIYGCLFLIGMVGNGTLAVSLWWGRGSKSPLLLGLVVADFFVCCLSGPITAALYTLPPNSTAWLLVAQFMQCLEHVYIHFSIIVSSMLLRELVNDDLQEYRNCMRMTKEQLNRLLNQTSPLITKNGAVMRAAIADEMELEITSDRYLAIGSSSYRTFKHPWKKGLMIGRITLVHIIPACTVMLSHLGVHAKLTALSLTARAKHGELPLPIPLMRRPTHVIIVAGMPQ
ncbi:hypothetical protein NQ314_016279, partial [Rhamnusium bicolor]